MLANHFFPMKKLRIKVFFIRSHTEAQLPEILGIGSQGIVFSRPLDSLQRASIESCELHFMKKQGPVIRKVEEDLSVGSPPMVAQEQWLGFGGADLEGLRRDLILARCR